MPELLEAEIYRRAAERCVGRVCARVHVPDPSYVRGGLSASLLGRRLRGRTIHGVDRLGKVVTLDLAGVGLALRFGMTGRLLVDGVGPIDRLEYGPAGDRWVRFELRLVDGGSLAIVDPRRLGSVELEPDLSGLGPDAARLTLGQLRTAVAGAHAPLKARLLDQARIAGLGNLLTDEILWRAGLDPARPAGGLSEVETVQLHRTIRSTLRQLDGRGGSHTGDLQEFRSLDAPCPRCGDPLLRRTIGGRTTYSCRTHQV
ncbi:MAG TPA: DNA-formamidopyrimidine glycosylase family protein [Microthrixaceae bacterium]|nr:DNA-formamidopyrimidine glycosylase family protein [Microthrixaceae bacterium]